MIDATGALFRFVVGVVVSFGVTAGCSIPGARVADGQSHLEGIVVIGTSASWGLGVESERGLRIDFGQVLKPQLAEGDSTVFCLANPRMFLDAEEVATVACRQAQEYSPTLVIAVDFLFWFCYGFASETERVEQFEAGLTLLDRFDCPIVVGDIPNMSIALGGIGPLRRPLLSSSEIPSQGVLKSVNRRLRAWADKRSVVVLPAEFALTP